MSEDLEEIKHVPAFDHDIDPMTLSQLPTDYQPLAMSLSKLRAEVRWGNETMIKGYNIGVRNAKFIRRYGGPIAFGAWFGSALLGAAAIKLVDKFF